MGSHRISVVSILELVLAGLQILLFGPIEDHELIAYERESSFCDMDFMTIQRLMMMSMDFLNPNEQNRQIAIVSVDDVVLIHHYDCSHLRICPHQQLPKKFVVSS